MALIVKTAPIGVDAKIDQLQRFLYTKLSWTNYESYHRGYRNPKEGNFIPEVNTGNGEYKEVFFNDDFSATSYFLVDEENPIEKRGIKATVSLYFQIKLDEIEPNIPHRADEEVLNEVLYWVNKAGLGIKAESVVTGIPNVYSGLKQDQVTFDNMGNFFVFRIILDFPIILPDFCPGVIVPVCADATITDSDGVSTFEVASGGTGACTLATDDIDLRFNFAIGDDVTDTAIIDVFTAGIYTSISDDGSSGVITVSINGGAFVAFSTLNPLTLIATDTIAFKRTITTAIGHAQITGTF